MSTEFGLFVGNIQVNTFAYFYKVCFSEIFNLVFYSNMLLYVDGRDKENLFKVTWNLIISVDTLKKVIFV